MNIRPEDRRRVGIERDYPGGYGWPIYQYRCPECGQWADGSAVTTVHEDGTESMRCQLCAAKVWPEIKE